MTEKQIALLFINDFADHGNERFYFVSDQVVQEVSASEVVNQEAELICHDYWLIAPALYRQTKSLPKNVIDVEELRISTSGLREDRENRESRDVCTALLELDLLKEEVVGNYRNILFKNAALDKDSFALVGEALLRLARNVKEQAQAAKEWERYSTIERPVSEYLIRSVVNGIAINGVALRKHKDDIDFAYYMALKEFSAKYCLPLEVPSDDDVIDYLSPKGFDFSGVGVDYVLNFVPTADGFSDRLLELRKIATSRFVLNAVPLSAKRIFPIVDSFGSITSRIYYKDPSLQNLAKRHRDIVAPDVGKKLSYVDFGQFEAGIMGAISGDQKMLALFSSGDLYSLAAEEIFNDASKRKPAKRLFLSYAYGMKKRNLIDASVEFGAPRAVAKAFFNQFVAFEKWKSEIWETFKSDGRIGAATGNYMARSGSGDLSDKEKRSAVSQVIQGTASLIFKKALLKMSLLPQVELKVPMHDAVLFQHSEDFDPNEIANIFADVVTEHFDGKIIGKASVTNFFLD